MLTAADRLDDKARFELGADDYLTNRSSCESSSSLRALDPGVHRAGDPCERSQVSGLDRFPERSSRRTLRRADQGAVGVLEVSSLPRRCRQRGRAPSRAWDENADPFDGRRADHGLGTRERLGEP